MGVATTGIEPGAKSAKVRSGARYGRKQGVEALSVDELHGGQRELRMRKRTASARSSVLVHAAMFQLLGNYSSILAGKTVLMIGKHR